VKQDSGAKIAFLVSKKFNRINSWQEGDPGLQEVEIAKERQAGYLS
jgi:hypothetical protein